MTMNSKLNTVAEVSAMLMGLSEVELESVKVYIATLSGLRTVSAPVVAEPAPATTTVAPKAEVKTRKVSAPKTAEPKSAKVIKVDKYGNQWVAEYKADVYAAKKAEMIANGTYDPKNRTKVYKALGWVL